MTKKTNKTPSEQVYIVLQDLHKYIDEHVFKPRKTPLPMPVFTISATSRAKGRLGYFEKGKWRHVKSEDGKPEATGKEEIRPDEINVDGQNGMSRPFIQIAATIFHEMSHQAQHHYPTVYGKPAKKGDYHNKGWHTTCQICGLETKGAKGETKVTDEFKEFMKDFPNPERWIAQRPIIKKDTAATRMRKWTCKCEEHVVDMEASKTKEGPYVIRVAGTGLRAQCQFCRTMFVEEED